MARVEGVSAGSEGGERDETAAAAAGSEVGTGMVRGMERPAEAGRVARELENLPSRGNFCDQDGDCPCHREGTCRVGKDFLAHAVDCTAVALRSGSSLLASVGRWVTALNVVLLVLTLLVLIVVRAAVSMRLDSGALELVHES